MMMMMLYLITLVLFMHAVGYEAKQIADEKLDEALLIHKRAVWPRTKNAYDNNFDSCMFNFWPKRPAVLKSSPTSMCHSSGHTRLCYGDGKSTRAQFISCYNTAKLIPEFTAHIVPYLPTGSTGVSGRGNYKFKMDTGTFAPSPQAKVDDCAPADQEKKFKWSEAKNFFCSKGHLTPNGAFDTAAERDRTFIMTNVAPQWQSFNGGNWGKVERAVKEYADKKQREVYVFTGTAGNPSYWTYGWWWIPIWKEGYKVGGKVLVPEYFWKAVCDPVDKVSIVFVAKNNINEQSTTKETRNTCFGKPMTKKSGIIECYSLDDANTKYGPKKGFLFPDFNPTTCTTNKEGVFLKPYLKFE